ncbi:MAG: sugar phosphate isomerase/epimerase family protein [Thermodesulfobacteriota bacterium]|nr:sugar phosphate isomerase/epimerase family protein [Thermodesulfobacteriota bacterium]
MSRIEEKVQVNIPFSMLWDSYIELFIKNRLNPEIGLDAISLKQFSKDDFKKIARRLHRQGLTITLHAPFIDLSPGSLDPDVMELTRYRFKQLVELVPLFKPKTVVCHAGYDWKRYGYFKEEWVEKSLQTWSWLGSLIAGEGGQLMLENVYEHSPEDIRVLFENLENQHVGFCLDTGHQYAFSRTSLKGWLDSLGPYLGQLHLHDNNGKFDDHLAMGNGKINFEAFFSALKEIKKTPPVITLEPHQDKALWPSLEFLEKAWPW